MPVLVFSKVRLSYSSVFLLSRPWSSTKYTEISSQAKKRRKADGGDAPEQTVSPPLSPEQLDRIARNKKAALERLSVRSGPEGLGESWRKALAAEFGKPYLGQASAESFSQRGSTRFQNVHP